MSQSFVPLPIRRLSLSKQLHPCTEQQNLDEEKSKHFGLVGQNVGIFFGCNVFQSCSNRFSKGSPAVPNTFTIAPQINPIWDAQSSTEKVGLPIGKCVCLYFVTGVQRKR